MALEEGLRPNDEKQLLCEDELTPAQLRADADAVLTDEKLPLFEKGALVGARDAGRGLAFSDAGTGRPRARPWHRAAKWTCFCLLLVAGFLVHTGAYRTMPTPHCARPGPRPPLPLTNSSTLTVPPPSSSAMVSSSAMAVVPPSHNQTLGAPTPRPNPSTPSTSAVRPGPTAAPRSGPRHRDSVMLLDRGRGHHEVWVWSRTRNNTLVRRALYRPGAVAAAWEDGGASAPPFLGAPVVAPALALGGQAHLAFAVEAETGDMAYSLWQSRDGWRAGGGAWTRLGGGRRFVYQPTVAVDSRGDVTVFAVAADGYLWANALVRTHPGPGWGGWRVVAGGFAGEVALAPARARERRAHPVYLVGLKDGQYQAARALRGPFVYQALGVPGPCGGGGGAELGWPRLLEHAGDPLQLFVACAGRVWNKAHDPATGAWEAAWRAWDDGRLGHLAHGQVATADRLLSRTADGCVYSRGRHGLEGPNQPLWDPWQQLWCPAVPRNLTGDAARNLTLAVSERPQSVVSVLIEDVDGKLYYNRLLSLSVLSQPFELVERPE